MAGTLMPVPRQQFFDDDGNPLAGGKLRAYLAGTTTPTDLYTDSDLLVPHPWPAVLDAHGRITVYLAGIGYKIDLSDASDVSIDGYPVDNISAVPGFGSASDVSGEAGENISARDAVYLSDGSTAQGGAPSAGKWMRLNATTFERAVSPGVVGVAPAAIASGATGTIRTGGLVTGFSGLTTGAIYWASTTAGLITSTRPRNLRMVGQAVSATVLLVVDQTAQRAIDTTPAVVASFGGVSNIGRADTSYPAGLTADTFAPGSHAVPVVENRLPPGVYKLRGRAAIDNAAATATVALFELATDTAVVEVSTTSLTGELLESAAITINHGVTSETQYCIKVKTSNGLYLAYAWGFELIRETF